MSIALAACNLWAQVDSLESFVSALRDKKGRLGTGDVFVGLLLLAGMFVVLWALARVLDLYYRKMPHWSPHRLLFSLCRAHGLRWSQWWLLRQIARHQQLENPARLFVEPERLDPASLGPLFHAHRLRIQVIRARLFADLREMARGPEPEPRKKAKADRPSESPMPLFPPNTLPKLDVPPWPPAGGAGQDLSPPAPHG